MCLSVPARVLAIEGSTATVDAGGNRLQAELALLETVEVGDYVLVHAGFAIDKYDQQEAEEVLALLRESLSGPSQTVPGQAPGPEAAGPDPRAG